MYLTYHPEGDEEPQKFTFIPEETNTFDAEHIETVTGWTWEEFLMNLQKGSMKARRTLLWMMLQKIHRGLQLRDVHFKGSEVKLEYDTAEYDRMLEKIRESPDQAGVNKQDVLDAIEAERAKAPEPPSNTPGKAPELVSGANTPLPSHRPALTL